MAVLRQKALLLLAVGLALTGASCSRSSPGIGSDQPAAAIQDRKSIGQWIALLSSKNPIERQNAAIAIGKLGPAGLPALTALSAALKDKDAGVALSAADALGQIGEKGIERLVQGLQTEDEAIDCSQALTKVGPAAIGPVMELLGSSKPMVATYAQVTLAGIGEPAIPALMEALGSDRVQRRGLALAALVQIGAPARVAMPQIERLVHDPHPGIQKLAREVVDHLSNVRGR